MISERPAEAIDRAVQEQISQRADAAPPELRIEAREGAGNRILAKRLITPEIAWFEVEAPEVARHWKPGQFVVIRPTATSERIPLTIVDGDVSRGTIHLVVQAVGKTSRAMVAKQAGETLADVLGPLGQPATIENPSGSARWWGIL